MVWCAGVLQCVADQLDVYCSGAAVNIIIPLSRMEWAPHKHDVVLWCAGVLQRVAMCCSVLQCVADQLDVVCSAAAVHQRIRTSHIEWLPHRSDVASRNEGV